LAAALTSFYLESKKQALEIYLGILTVSFAAQIGTMPLSIYYFHQFQVYFSSRTSQSSVAKFIMTLGILVMVLASFNYVPLFLSKPLEWSIYYLNKIINSIASFENFIIRDIPLNTYLLLSSYLLIVASIIWFKKPNFNKLIIVLLAIIATQVTYIHTQWTIKTSKNG
jgi:competence protein ComEC